MSGETNPEPLHLPLSTGPSMSRLRSSGHVPPILAVALVMAVLGLLVGFGVGYHLGNVVSAPSPSPDVRVDSVSTRLERAFQSTAPGGWAVCDLGGKIACTKLDPMSTEPRVPPSEFGLGWYGNRQLNRALVDPAHKVLAAVLGQGSVIAHLYRVGPGDVLLEDVLLAPVNPGRAEAFYFDLGTLGTGHYVVEADFQALPVTPSAFMVHAFVAGFVIS